MKKEIKFSLVYRDMWQSSGKYQPRADQLARIAPLIIEMGCFARVETNGGAFEQVNLLYGENPNKAVRTFTKPLHEAGIQTHMLDRGLNALRMYPVPADVRRLMYKVKHAQGVDITRIFCGLNEVRNIIPSIKYAKEAGMIPQATLCITYSPVHTVEYYSRIADQLIEAGAPEICLKDMAGIGRPEMLGQLVKNIKEKHPEVIVQYHGHTGPGLSMASILEVCENGADIIDVAMEPLSWGKVHPDVISVQAMLKNAGFRVPEINMKAYMKARSMTQEFIDDFLGYFIDPTNKHMSSLLLGCGLPGGMMGSMMADLKGVHSGINLILKGQDQGGVVIPLPPCHGSGGQNRAPVVPPCQVRQEENPGQEPEGSCKNHAGKKNVHQLPPDPGSLAHPQQNKLLLPVAEGRIGDQEHKRQENGDKITRVAGQQREQPGAHGISQRPAVGHKPLGLIPHIEDHVHGHKGIFGVDPPL